jgi:serine/threonine protein kinase
MDDHAADSSTENAKRPPEVPDFALIRPIGEGGFGRVWLAANRTTGHLRAVKVIPLGRSGTLDPAGREITSLARLEANLRRQHPNLLVIHHVGKTADHLFYVMDLADDVSGAPGSCEAGYRPATLESRLQKGPLAPEESLHCARQLLAGLASLHAAGMVHRDVKPSNCLFVDGQLKLADFGLLTEASPQVSRLGTQTYMPPDGRMDARADVYAAGLVIYEMITGLPAVSFPRLGGRAREIVQEPTSNALIRLVLRACQPDPHKRFQDAREMLAELASQFETPVHGARLYRRIAIAAGCGAIALAAAILAVWPKPPVRVHVNFITQPLFEATIYLDGQQQRTPEGTPYTTPCTIENLPACVHHVVFRRDGLPPRDAGRVDFAEVRQIVVRWETTNEE